MNLARTYELENCCKDFVCSENTNAANFADFFSSLLLGNHSDMSAEARVVQGSSGKPSTRNNFKTC